MIFIIRFSNSNKLCIDLGSGTQTKIRGAHLRRGVQCWVAQTNSGIWSSRKLKSFNHRQYWDAANNTIARSRTYCPGQMMAVKNRQRLELPWVSAFSNREILSESTDKCWKVRARFCLFVFKYIRFEILITVLLKNQVLQMACCVTWQTLTDDAF